MKRLFTLLILSVLVCTSISAQRTDFRKFAERYKTVNTLIAKVRQTRHNEALTKDIVTNGHFYYRKPGNYSMVFRESEEMLIASGNSFIMVRDGKQHVAKAKGKGNNPFEIIQDVFRKLLSADRDANLSDMADVKLEIQDHVCTITIKPIVTNTKVKRRSMFTSCIASVDLKAIELCSLRINERGENYTQYDFSNYVFDAEVSDNVFDSQTMM
jgi:outer membrane lipoprotein-sorting protein